jgi:hypothetical protein
MSPDLARYVFHAFDRDDDGSISWEEFVCGNAVIIKGAFFEKLLMVANACDPVSPIYKDASRIMCLNFFLGPRKMANGPDTTLNVFCKQSEKK